MKTYILKYPVYNSICFPEGTTVKLSEDREDIFIVTKGRLKGETGCVADGLNGWLLADNIKNRKLLKLFADEKRKLRNAEINLQRRWDILPTVSI